MNKSKTITVNNIEATITVIKSVRTVPSRNPDLEDNSNFNIHYHNVMIQSPLYSETKCGTTDEIESIIEFMEDRFETIANRSGERTESFLDKILTIKGFK